MNGHKKPTLYNSTEWENIISVILTVFLQIQRENKRE